MSHKTEPPWSLWVSKATIGEQRLPGAGKPRFLFGGFIYVSCHSKETLLLSIDPHYGSLPYPSSRDLIVRAIDGPSNKVPGSLGLNKSPYFLNPKP